MTSLAYRRQLIATLLANLTSFAYGIAIGWPSPNIPRFQSEHTPLRDNHVLTLDEVSWVGSIYLFGGTVGSLVLGWMGERYGRKMTILVAAIFQVLAWILTEFGTSLNHLYLARLLVGFGGAACYIIIPIYVSEISSDKIRGALGSIVIVFSNLGITVGYAVNFYLDYYTVPYIVLGILVIFFIGFPFAAESPKYLAMKNRMEDAERSLKHFRGYAVTDEKFSDEVQAEFEVLKDISRPVDAVKQTKLTIKDFCSRSARRAIFISVFVNFLTIANGVEAIVNYSETVFVESGSDLSPAISSIIIGLILLVGSSASCILSDKAGRRVLMGVSSTGCGLSLAIMGVYSHLKEDGVAIPGYDWIPLASLSAFMLLGSIGILSLHLVIMVEVLSQKIRGVISTICLVENWFLAFICVKFFPIMLEVLGMSGCMLIFSLCCFLGTIFVLFVLPETKGKSIETIVKELEG